MCTAINQYGEYHLFGRTLDLEHTYGESVVLSPRGFTLEFTDQHRLSSHHAIMGVACIRDGIPLYFDAVNEMGLCAAALNFPSSCVFHKRANGSVNVASFELVPFILAKCGDISEAIKILENINIIDISFSSELPSTPLHWIFADKNGAVTVESIADGVRIYQNTVGVLTNDPPFPYHMTNITHYMDLNPAPPKNNLCPTIDLKPYSRGMGALGLPGDASSASRFIRAVYAKYHTQKTHTKEQSISRFFHIMDTVSQPCGYALTDSGAPVSTVYTSCADTSSFTYYFTTYGCRRIYAVKPSLHALDDTEITSFEMHHKEDIEYLS